MVDAGFGEPRQRRGRAYDMNRQLSLRGVCCPSRSTTDDGRRSNLISGIGIKEEYSFVENALIFIVILYNRVNMSRFPRDTAKGGTSNLHSAVFPKIVYKLVNVAR